MECRKKLVLSSIMSINIDSEERLDHAISLVMKQASGNPWFGDTSLTDVLRECKKISVSAHTKLGNGISCTFDEIILKNVHDEFEKLTNLKQRIKDIADYYKGPVERKESWIELHFKKLFPHQKYSISRRIQFCSYLFHQSLISCECMISIMEFLISFHSSNLQKLALKCLFDLVKVLVQGNEYSDVSEFSSPLPGSEGDNFFARPSVYGRLSDIVDRLRSSNKGNTMNNYEVQSGIYNIIQNIKLELEENEVAKVKLEAKKENELRIMEEKKNQLRLEYEKKKEEILSQGTLRSVEELQEKDFDTAMIVDLFN